MSAQGTVDVSVEEVEDGTQPEEAVEPLKKVEPITAAPVPIKKAEIYSALLMRNQRESQPAMREIIKYYKILIGKNKTLLTKMRQEEDKMLEMQNKPSLSYSDQEIAAMKQKLIEKEDLLTQSYKQNADHAKKLFAVMEEKKAAVETAEAAQNKFLTLTNNNEELMKKIDELSSIITILKKEVTSANKQRDKYKEKMLEVEKEAGDLRKLETEREIADDIRQREILTKNEQLKDLMTENQILYEKLQNIAQNDGASPSPAESQQNRPDGRQSGGFFKAIGKFFGDDEEKGGETEEKHFDFKIKMPSVEDRVPKGLKRSFPAHKEMVYQVRCNYQGNRFGTASGDGTVNVWDATSATLLKTLRGPRQRAFASVDFSGSGELVLGGATDNNIWVWNYESGRPLHTLTGHRGAVGPAQFSLDWKNVVSGSKDRTIKIWDLEKGFCTTTIMCGSRCNDICFTQRGVVCSAHYDKTVRLHDIRNGKEVHRVSAHTGQVTSVCVSPDQVYLLSNSRDNTMILFDKRSMLKQIRTFKSRKYRNGADWNKACFSGSGKYVIAGGYDGTITFWESHTGKVAGELRDEDHGMTVGCATWNALTAQLLTTYSEKATVAIWQ